MDVFIVLIRFANFKEEIVSCLHEGNIEQVTITRVIEFPERDSCKTLVNFESLKGTCYWPLLSA